MKRSLSILLISLVLAACSKDTSKPLGPSIDTEYPFYSDYEIFNEIWVTDFNWTEGIPSDGLDVDIALILGIPIHCYAPEASKPLNGTMLIWTNEVIDGQPNHYMKYYFEQNAFPGVGWIWYAINAQFANGNVDVTEFGNAIRIKVRGEGRMNFKFSSNLTKLIPLTAEWVEHIIRFEELNGFASYSGDLKNVESIAFGPEENKPGTSGMVNIDDIQFVTYRIKR